MPKSQTAEYTDVIAKNLIPFWEFEAPKEILGRVNGAKLVFISDSSHGTHEFYTWRADLSERLIRDFGFNFVAIEGEWPAGQAVSRYIAGGIGANAEAVLRAHFHHWPGWMWANHETARLVEVLRQISLETSPKREIGFHGLDLYSLGESAREVPRLVESFDPALAAWVRERYQSFEPFMDVDENYPRGLYRQEAGPKNTYYEGAARNVYDRLLELTQNSPPPRDPSLFEALQNSIVVANAEHYYRGLVEGEDTWRIRDRHMLQMLENLLEQYGSDARGIVWCHVNHAGNYLAQGLENLAQTGYVNLGGLARKAYGTDKVVSIAMGTYDGSVTAARGWGAPPLSETIPPARPDSFENDCRLAGERQGTDRFALVFNEKLRRGSLNTACHHRYFTVTFDPAKSVDGEYVHVPLASWYDAFVFFERTRGLELLPLEKATGVEKPFEL